MSTGREDPGDDEETMAGRLGREPGGQPGRIWPLKMSGLLLLPFEMAGAETGTKLHGAGEEGRFHPTF